MSETLQSHPVIEYVHSVATRSGKESDGVNIALRQFESFLTAALVERQGRKLPQLPIVVKYTVFNRLTKPSPELNGDTPPVAILRTIAHETGTRLTGEFEVFRRGKSGRHRVEPRDIFVIREEDSLPAPEPEKPYRADRQVRNGEIFTSISEMRRGGVQVGRDQLRALLSDLPTAVALAKNGSPVLLYSEKEAVMAINEWIEQEGRRVALKESHVYRLDPAIWVPSKYYANVYDVTLGTVNRILSEVSTERFRGKLYFMRNQADETFTEHYRKKSIGGLYFRDNKPLATITYLYGRTGVDHAKLRRELDSLAAIDEETGNILYPLADALEVISKIKGIPHVSSEGTYTDAEQRKWGGKRVLKELLGISYTKLAEYLEGADRMPIRGNRGKPDAYDVYVAYVIEEIRERASSYLTRPTLKEAKAVGSTLIVAEDLEKEYKIYGVPRYVIQILLSSIRIPLRDDKVKFAYPAVAAWAYLDDFIALPKWNRKKRQYIGEDGITYVERKGAHNNLGVSFDLVDKAIESGSVRHRQVRGQRGTFDVYAEVDIAIFKAGYRIRKNRRPKYTNAELEDQGRAILASGDNLDTTLRTKHSAWVGNVTRNYPGGVVAMRANLKAEHTVRKKTDYRNMTEPQRNAHIEDLANKILGERNNLSLEELRFILSPGELRRNGHNTVENAARKHYTKRGGGLKGLCDELIRKRGLQK